MNGTLPERGGAQLPAPPAASVARPAGARPPRRRLALLVAGVGAVVLWGSCSVERHYALLSMFFDGVPDPALLRQSEDALALARRTGGEIFAHAPYAQGQCGDCHSGGAGRMLTQVEPTVCLKCHEGVRSEHRYMHGPVVADACVWCHAPHESTIARLLRVPSQQLCQQCHSTSLGRRRTEIVEHRDPARDCLDCHSGHGGERRAYLRAHGPGTGDADR
ncbi:MAG: hypothetical protein KF817_04210 [Phycisphaeraceae bacterium]|nr:hypothetical protein [Phycisphaeraceae bacterium]